MSRIMSPTQYSFQLNVTKLLIQTAQRYQLKYIAHVLIRIRRLLEIYICYNY